ncbi:unknown similar to AMEV080 [Mythimna separata entomopoxvirus 'L']|uniref:Uncharacterized protein n=1 Tax=Mythimna separata entomopoxvirus 'L' TaxID=1293572 RepID=A0A916KQG0_9POXV|nr:unknown similar to AMEV080 [Mythimna separata entomopoxvirus 'L']CCU56301.1 unknown similar to AMEV080 [Mythimna separata entomopoxvirus 'L']
MSLYITSIIFIIIIVSMILFLTYYLLEINNKEDNTLNAFDDEYLSNLRFIPEQIFDYNVGNYNDLLQQLEELRIRYQTLNNTYNQLISERDVYLTLIEDQNDNIMNLRNEINRLKTEIGNNANNLFL